MIAVAVIRSYQSSQRAVGKREYAHHHGIYTCDGDGGARRYGYAGALPQSGWNRTPVVNSASELPDDPLGLPEYYQKLDYENNTLLLAI